MSEEQEEITPPEQPRNDRGQFAPQTQTDSTDRSQPNITDYVKMNSYLAQQLKITDKLAELQTKNTPSELFKQLSFMADNLPSKTTDKLPPNQPIAPTSSQGDNKKIKIDNFTLRTEMDSKEGAFHGDISIIDILTNKKRK